MPTGSVSGTVTYSGSRPGMLYIGLFNTPNIAPGVAPQYVVSLNATGTNTAYTLSGVLNGTYYVGAIKTVDPNAIAMEDPYGMYGVDFITDFNADPVTITSGIALTDKNFLMINGTVENPNPFYHPAQFTLMVSKEGSGSGTVTSIPSGIDCGLDCTEDYGNNTLVTLTKAPPGRGSPRFPPGAPP